MRFQTHLCQSHLHRGHYAEISASWAPVCEHVGLEISYLKTRRSTPAFGLSKSMGSCVVCCVVWLICCVMLSLLGVVPNSFSFIFHHLLYTTDFIFSFVFVDEETMNLLAGATRMPMRGKVYVSEDSFALRFWYGKISDRFCSELPHEWGFAERKNRKVLVL